MCMHIHIYKCMIAFATADNLLLLLLLLPPLLLLLLLLFWCKSLDIFYLDNCKLCLISLTHKYFIQKGRKEEEARRKQPNYSRKRAQSTSRKTGLNLSVSAPFQFLAASTGDRPEQKERTYAIGQSRNKGLMRQARAETKGLMRQARAETKDLCDRPEQKQRTYATGQSRNKGLMRQARGERLDLPFDCLRLLGSLHARYEVPAERLDLPY